MLERIAEYSPHHNICRVGTGRHTLDNDGSRSYLAWYALTVKFGSIAGETVVEESVVNIRSKFILHHLRSDKIPFPALVVFAATRFAEVGYNAIAAVDIVDVVFNPAEIIYLKIGLYNGIF